MKNKGKVWKWDGWQREVLEHEGNVVIRSGRQVGKSVVIAEKAVRFAVDHAGVEIMVLAASQRQAALLFEKIRGSFLLRDECIFSEVPTLSKMTINNGSVVRCVPAGKTGDFIRGFTIDLLIVDEAAFVPEPVWLAVIPMIAVSQKERGFGWQFLLSTPFGKGGYFYHAFSDSDFRSWHVSSERCSRIPKGLLLKEKKRLSKAAYAQEWLGEFTEEFYQFFKTDLIRRQMSFIEWGLKDRISGNFYLGVDVARYGGDENAFVVVELIGSGDSSRIKAVKCLTTENVSTVETIAMCLALDGQFGGFKRIFVDDSGVGGGVTDMLIHKLGRRVVGLNNASKSVRVKDVEKSRNILKEDLYSNVLVLLENGRLDLINDLKLLRSMRSISFKYSVDIAGRVNIFGSYSHLTEALVRACWCVKDKGLDIYCF